MLAFSRSQQHQTVETETSKNVWILVLLVIVLFPSKFLFSHCWLLYNISEMCVGWYIYIIFYACIQVWLLWRNMYQVLCVTAWNSFLNLLWQQVQLQVVGEKIHSTKVFFIKLLFLSVWIAVWLISCTIRLDMERKSLECVPLYISSLWIVTVSHMWYKFVSCIHIYIYQKSCFCLFFQVSNCLIWYYSWTGCYDQYWAWSI